MDASKPIDPTIKILFQDIEVPFYRVDPLRTVSMIRQDLVLERPDLFSGPSYSTGLVDVGAGHVVNRCGHIAIKVQMTRGFITKLLVHEFLLVQDLETPILVGLDLLSLTLYREPSFMSVVERTGSLLGCFTNDHATVMIAFGPISFSDVLVDGMSLTMGSYFTRARGVITILSRSETYHVLFVGHEG